MKIIALVRYSINRLSLPLLFFAVAIPGFRCAPRHNNGSDLSQAALDSIVKPIMEQYNIAGMSVGVTTNGSQLFFNYGVASKIAQQQVTSETLFEIGSVSKTFNVTLAAYAQITGHLSLTDSVSKHLPALKGSSFDNIQLINLGTHTAGGLPLQLPDSIGDSVQLMNYYKQWQPAYAPGTYRVYSNPSIGLLGVVSATSMGQSYKASIENKLFTALGLTNSYIDVPADKMEAYAQGYNKKDSAVRVNPAVLDAQAYGVKSCTKDLVRFLEANMGMLQLDKQLEQAINLTHTGYYRSGVLVQDMIWEAYKYPTDLNTLLEGNSEKMILNAVPAVKINPDSLARQDMLFNKTGSTNGFGAYVLFIPSKRTGIVILANKSFPIPARVSIAYQILARLEAKHQ